VNDPGRIFELSTRTRDGVIRWHRETDGSLTTWDDGDRVVLYRSVRGRVRLTIRTRSSSQTFESGNQNVTGELVVLWALADARAEPD